MKNKIILGTITLIISIIIIILLMHKPKVIENQYEILNNPNATYKYINTYEQYKDFIDKNENNKITRELTKKDFEEKQYLFYTINIDSCSETIEHDKIEESKDRYKIYFDISYRCGVCPLTSTTYVYEVEKKLDVEVYTRTIKTEACDPNISYKPIIYIYPEEEIDLTIKLKNEKDLLYTYPKYKNAWNVRVSKDGNIYDYDTKRNYYGLYWEGIDNYKLKMDEGFVVKGKDSVKFLEEKLEILGLNEYEINEFIIYWIDKLENNEYNFISFRNEKDINMPLEFSKEPDTLIRVMMDFKKLDKKVEVKEQILKKQERKGFTIVEWGGTYHK